MTNSTIKAWFTFVFVFLLHLWNVHLVTWMSQHIIGTFNNFHLLLHTYPVCIHHHVTGLWGLQLFVSWHQCKGRTWTHPSGIAAGMQCSLCASQLMELLSAKSHFLFSSVHISVKLSVVTQFSSIFHSLISPLWLKFTLNLYNTIFWFSHLPSFNSYSKRYCVPLLPDQIIM